MKTSSILHKKFRHSNAYHLKEWAQLSQHEQETLAGLYDEQDVYGIFQPNTNTISHTAKIAYRETALLYLHLQHQDNIPRCFTVLNDDSVTETLAELVLENILEIEKDGNFIGGGAAASIIYGNAIIKDRGPANYISKLSMQAIRYGLLLRNLDVKSLAVKLYTFNTAPWNENAREAFYSTHTVQQFLFSNADDSLLKTLNDEWQFSSRSKGGWLSWTRSGAGQFLSTHKPTYKLYISPYINDVPKVLCRTIPVITESGAFSFKIGASVQGLLRSDKMVIYFEDRKMLVETAGMLEKIFKGTPAQGVPFTSQVDSTGLLSCGIDPPKKDVLASIEVGSWRARLTDQLALAIIQAQTDKMNLDEAIHFIRAKLSTNGIDIFDWTKH